MSTKNTEQNKRPSISLETLLDTFRNSPNKAYKVISNRYPTKQYLEQEVLPALTSAGNFCYVVVFEGEYMFNNVKRIGRAFAFVRHFRQGEFDEFLKDTPVNVGTNKVLVNCRTVKYRRLRDTDENKQKLNNYVTKEQETLEQETLEQETLEQETLEQYENV